MTDGKDFRGVLRGALGPVLWLLGIILWGINAIILFIIISLKAVIDIFKSVVVVLPSKLERIVPSPLQGRLNQLLVYAGIKRTSSDVISITLIYSLVLSIMTYLILYILKVSIPILLMSTVVVFIFVWLVMYATVNFLMEKRAEIIEEVLPDILDMISQNMIAGMTTYNALWSAARPEFGPLAVEIQTVARATLAGTPLTDALIGMTNRIKSMRLERSVKLIIQGIQSGGELPNVLKGISADMRAEHNLRKEIRAETNINTIFILFSILVGAPVLFAVSLQFITIFSTLFSRINVSELTNISRHTMITLRELSISPEFFMQYAMAILIVLSFYGALLIGLVRTGKIITGIRNIPILIIVSTGVFFLVNYLLEIFLSGLMRL